jgi:hypothetical protein
MDLIPKRNINNWEVTFDKTCNAATIVITELKQSRNKMLNKAKELVRRV